MISVEQIHHLEARIERVLGMLAELRTANAALTAELQAANAGIEESAGKLEESERARLAAEQKLLDLEGSLHRLRTDQEEIEATINRALHQLDELEVDLPEPPSDSTEATADEAVTAAAAEPAAATADELPEPDGGEQPDAAEPPATTGAEPPPSREGAELDIF
jgi:chromosome segregation ATPase